MHRDDHVRIERLDLGDDLLEIVGGAGPRWKPPTSACTFCTPDTSCACLAELTMPTWPQELITTKPRSFTLKQVACSWMCSSGTILPSSSAGVIVAGVAAEPVLHGEFDPLFGSTFSMLRALDLAGGEGMTDDRRRILRQHGLDVARRQLAPVERAELGKLSWRAAVAMAEIVLAAGVEREVGRQPLRYLSRKPIRPPK